MTDASVPKVNRRTLLDGLGRRRRRRRRPGLGVGNYWLGGGSRVSRSVGKKVIVIGIDGMDPRLSESMMKAGLLPNLDKLRAGGGFSTLGTSTPPQSPVAWANFINGAGPGSHGIFDFIHRHPQEQCAPFYSAAETVPGEGFWEVGDHRLQLDFWPFNHKPPDDRAPAPGRAVLGLPRRRGRPLDLLRPAVQLSGQPVAPRPPPLHLRHGHAGHARAPTAPISTSPRTARPSRSTKAAASGRG